MATSSTTVTVSAKHYSDGMDGLGEAKVKFLATPGVDAEEWQVEASFEDGAEETIVLKVPVAAAEKWTERRDAIREEFSS
jgi:hypothetical protein